jgi:hypothetical protein
MTAPQPQPGESCPSCKAGELRIYSSHNHGEFYVRYFDCDTCGAKPADNRVIVEAHEIKKRRPIKKAGLVRSTVSATNNMDLAPQLASIENGEQTSC